MLTKSRQPSTLDTLEARWKKISASLEQAESKLPALPLSEFTERMLGFKNPRHIRRWYRLLEDARIHYLLLLAPRHHAKSTCLSVNYPVWMLARDSSARIIIVSKTQGFAEGLLKEVKSHLEKLGLRSEQTGEPWGQSEATVRRPRVSKDSSVVALGVGSQVTGRHAEVIIADDIINEEDAASERMREKISVWFRKQLMPCLTPSGRIICVGTRWHYADFYSELLRSEEWHHHVDQAIRVNGSVLWPELWPRERLEEMKRMIGTIQFNCLVAGSKVLSAEGFTPIEQLQIGSSVMTHKGNWEKVEHTHSEQANEPIYEITIYGDPEPIRLTASHKLWSFKSRAYKSKRLAPHHKNLSTFVKTCIENAVGWHSARDLTKGDFLLTPIERTEQPSEHFDRNFWWMVGLYLADGSLNHNTGRVVISLSLNDKPVLDRLLSIAKKYAYSKPSIRHHGNLVVIDFSSRELFAYLNSFGRYSYGKRLTPEALKLPNELQTELWQGYVDGDGCKVKGREVISVSSVNLNLLRQFKQVLLRLKIVGYVAQTSKERQRKILGRTVHQRPQYALKVNLKPSRHRPAEIYDDYLYSRIRSISVSNESKTVYNLQVAKDHSYTTPQGAIANCQFQNDPSGLEGALFKRDWLHYYEHEPSELKIVWGCDLAISDRPDADYFVCAEVGYDSASKRLYLLRYHRAHLSFNSQVEYLKNSYSASLRKPLRIIVEANAYQQALPQTLRREGLPVLPRQVVKDKVTRLTALSVYFENETILVRREHEEFIDEFVQFPLGEHDDILDALELACSDILKHLQTENWLENYQPQIILAPSHQPYTWDNLMSKDTRPRKLTEMCNYCGSYAHSERRCPKLGEKRGS